jgi:hypothetical protein
MPFTETPDTENLDTQVIFALTLLGEFESGGQSGMADIAAVVMNRVAANQWWGKGIRQVCLWPWQFSCWNAGPDRDRIMAIARAPEPSADYRLALRLAEQATDAPADIVNGATHYFNHVSLPEADWPKWYTDLPDQKPCFVHEPHWFFNLSESG